MQHSSSMHGQRQTKEPGRQDGPPTSNDAGLLQLDGIGSFLLLPKPEVTIGPSTPGPGSLRKRSNRTNKETSGNTPGQTSGGRQVIDAGLMHEPTMPIVRLSRNDESYFLSAKKDIVINDRPCRSHLLSDGDRINVSRKCRIDFLQPSRISATAILKLVSGRLHRPDISSLILMDHTLIISSMSNSHLCIPGMDETVILIMKQGQLFGRVLKSTTGGIYDSTMTASTPIPTGKQTQLGPIWLTYSETGC